MQPIDPNKLDPDSLVPPVVVLVAESRRAYRVRYRNVAETPDEVFDAAQIEVRGPIGDPDQVLFSWIGSDDPPTGDALISSDAPGELTAEAWLVLDSYWDWQAQQS